MAVDLFAGIPVTDYEAALAWYEQLLGSAPAFYPNEIEAVWEMGEQRHIYIKAVPERAGHALLLLFVDDLDRRVQGISSRGIEPSLREFPSDGVCKVTYTDSDGNEICFGGFLS